MSTVNLKNKTILVTGAAGFIGSNLVKRIYEEVPSAAVIGIDNMNAYYDVALKEFRLNELAKYPTFTFVKGNIADKALITELFEKYKPAVVVNLAAQAGVRYSITNPDAYVESNLVGFFNILEACRHSYDDGQTGVEHLVYASSSSVYGSNKKVPYSTDDKVDNPVSLYAATKAYDDLSSDGVHPNDAGQEIYFETVKAVIDDNVAASTGKMKDTDVINADVHKFDNFVWYDASSDFEQVDDTTFTISTSASGILGIDYTYESGDNKADIYVDGELFESPTVTFDYDFSQRHILVVSDDCTVKNEIKVVFTSKEQADGFKGMCFSWE